MCLTDLICLKPPSNGVKKSSTVRNHPCFFSRAPKRHPDCTWPSGLCPKKTRNDALLKDYQLPSSPLIHPGRSTWNIIMEVWKIIFLSKWVICRFHVNLPGCKAFSRVKYFFLGGGNLFFWPLRFNRFVFLRTWGYQDKVQSRCWGVAVVPAGKWRRSRSLVSRCWWQSWSLDIQGNTSWGERWFR